MEPYKLDASLDANKVFLVKRSVLVDRFDPEMKLYKRKVNNFKFNTTNLGKLLLNKPQYGANESGIERVNEEDPRYIRITDINENGELINNLGATALVVEDKYILNNNDLIIARSGNTVGKAFLFKERNVNYKCFFAGYMIRFILNTKKVLPDYIFTFTQLNVYKEWVKAIQRTSGQPNINAEEYKSLPIPLPPIEIQENIVSIIQNAYTQKQAKEAEAKELLASIDTYLLNELGITLPEKDNSLEARIFTTNFTEVVGGRFDPFGIISQNMKIEGGIYENYPLRKLAVLQKGQSITSDKIIEGDYPVIAGGQSSPYNHNLYNHKGNVITVSASGAYSGYVWYHNSPIFASDCTMIYSKDETSITTLFLSEILKCKQSEIYSLQQGAGQPHVYARDLEKLQIPLPPLEKQNEIAEHIAEIRSKAKALQQEAEQILAEAKQRVEEIILG